MSCRERAFAARKRPRVVSDPAARGVPVKNSRIRSMMSPSGRGDASSSRCRMSRGNAHAASCAVTSDALGEPGDGDDTAVARRFSGTSSDDSCSRRDVEDRLLAATREAGAMGTLSRRARRAGAWCR